MIGIEKSLSLKEFKIIFDRLYKRLCFFANKYVNDISLSEDIVQEVFIKVWEKNPYFENQDKTEGFFYTAVRNKSLDFLRSKYAKDVKPYPSEKLEILQSDRHFMTEVFVIETSTLFENAINTLPAKNAEAIRLSLKAYTNKEIADEMDVSVDAVKKYKKLAYKEFRKTLGHLRVK